MPRNGTGTYTLVNNTWYPPVNGVLAQSSDWQPFIDDVASALTQSVSKDGQTPMTGNLPMGNNKITGLANGTANTDAATFAQTAGRLLAVQVFTASGTFTPNAATTRLVVVGNGAGGAGGGCGAPGAGTVCIGGGGASGARGIAHITSGFTPTVAVTIGAGGTGVTGNTGNPGAASSFGAFLTLPGGLGGSAGLVAAVSAANGGAPVVAGGSALLFASTGTAGGTVISSFASGFAMSGVGGSSDFGAGGRVNATGGAASSGVTASGFGAGGSGAAGNASGVAQAGGAGTGGVIFVYEYA